VLIDDVVRTFIKDIKGPIGIGFSGGQDSLCLLDILTRVRGDKEIRVIYCDHRWEGNKANRYYVEILCSSSNLPLSIYEWDQPKVSEGAARDFRLDSFREATEEFGLGAILLAHTASDKVETILYKMIRGTSARGMGGIKASSEWKGLKLIRPLLGMWREDTEAYCRDRSLTFYRDPSNSNMSFARNRIRGKVLRELIGINSNSREHILRLGRLVNDDDSYLSEIADMAYKDAIERTGSLSVERLLILKLPILRRVICIFLEALLDRCPNYEEIEHVLSLIEKIRKEPTLTYRSRDIRGGYQLEINKHELRDPIKGYKVRNI
jgi:tRNA(Ile)-lysidine synthase